MLYYLSRRPILMSEKPPLEDDVLQNLRESLTKLHAAQTGIQVKYDVEHLGLEANLTKVEYTLRGAIHKLEEQQTDD